MIPISLYSMCSEKFKDFNTSILNKNSNYFDETCLISDSLSLDFKRYDIGMLFQHGL